jgi:hypothetical protein
MIRAAMMLFLCASLPRLRAVPSFKMSTGCPAWVVRYAIQIPLTVKFQIYLDNFLLEYKVTSANYA